MIAGGGSETDRPDPAPAAPGVVITRPPAAAAVLAATLAERGIAAIALALQEPGPPVDGGTALADAVARLDRYRWLVATSANGVRSVAAVGLPDPLPAGLGVGAVGPATARAWRRAGVEVAVVATARGPATATAADLARSLPAARPGDRVLAPLAERAGPDLERILTDRGYEVDRVDAYRMVPTVVAPVQRRQVGQARAVVLTAPSTAERLVEEMGRPHPAPAVAIGHRTATRARELGFDPVEVATDPGPEALADAAVRLLADPTRTRT